MYQFQIYLTRKSGIHQYSEKGNYLNKWETGARSGLSYKTRTVRH